jgi:hypothetical protein
VLEDIEMIIKKRYNSKNVIDKGVLEAFVGLSL